MQRLWEREPYTKDVATAKLHYISESVKVCGTLIRTKDDEKRVLCADCSDTGNERQAYYELHQMRSTCANLIEILLQPS